MDVVCRGAVCSERAGFDRLCCYVRVVDARGGLLKGAVGAKEEQGAAVDVQVAAGTRGGSYLVADESKENENS